MNILQTKASAHITYYAHITSSYPTFFIRTRWNKKNWGTIFLLHSFSHHLEFENGRQNGGFLTICPTISISCKYMQLFEIFFNVKRQANFRK